MINLKRQLQSASCKNLLKDSDNNIIEFQSQNEIDLKLFQFQKEYRVKNKIQLSNFDDKKHDIQNLYRMSLINILQAFLDSIIISQIDKKKQSDINQDDKRISKNILKLFGINDLVLKNIKDKQQQSNSIITSMIKVVDNLFKKWCKEINQNDKKSDNCQEQQNTNDLHHWAQIQTSYPAIKNKLKTILIENINEYENQIEAIKYLENQDQEKALKLIKYEKASTYQTLQNIIKEQQKVDILDKEIVNQQSWNKEFEQKFHQFQKEVSSYQFRQSKTANYTKQANQKMARLILDQESTNQNRENLLEQFFAGELLQEPDLKFLINSNELLNKCIDKRFILNVIDVLDKDIIQEMELQLAEKILHNYFKVNELNKQLRTQYLNKKLVTTKNVLQRNESARQLQTNKLQLKLLHEKKKKTVQVIEKKIQFKEIKEEIIIEKKLQKIYQQKEKKTEQQLRQQVIELNEEISDKKFQQFLKNQKTTRLNQKNTKFYETNQKEMIRKQLYPQSKLLLQKPLPQNAQNDIDKQEQNEAKINKQKNLEISYRNKMKSPKIYKEKINFQNIFTGGPQKQKNDDDYNLETLKQKNSRQIILIQTHIRKKLAIKKLQKLKDDFMNQKIDKQFSQVQYGRNLYNTNKEPNVQIPTLQKYQCQKNSQQISSSKTLDTQVSNEKFSLFKHDTKLRHSGINFGVINQMNELFTKDNETTIDQNNLLRKKAIQPRVFSKQNMQLKHLKLFELVKKKYLAQLTKFEFNYYSHDVDILDEKQLSPLMYAVLNNDFNFTKFLLHKNANPNLQGIRGNTAIHYAFKNQNIDLIMILTDAGGNLNIMNNKNLTPLAYGDQNLLKNLNLITGICQSQKNNGDEFSLDNNLLVNKMTTRDFDQEFDYKANFQYKKLARPFKDANNDKNQVQSYVF